jgi:hypothetical protein
VLQWYFWWGSSTPPPCLLTLSVHLPRWLMCRFNSLRSGRISPHSASAGRCGECTSWSSGRILPRPPKCSPILSVPWPTGMWRCLVRRTCRLRERESPPGLLCSAGVHRVYCCPLAVAMSVYSPPKLWRRLVHRVKSWRSGQTPQCGALVGSCDEFPRWSSGQIQPWPPK